MQPKLRLMLISNSVCAGGGYLEHCRQAIDEFLDEHQTVVFVPYAQSDWYAATDNMRRALEPIGRQVVGIHEADVARHLIADHNAVFVGGGNTFRLKKTLEARGEVTLLRDAAALGYPYIGSSAGSNLACPTIRTTNDMPIMSPASMDGLGLVPFQINPHFFDADPNSTHRGETREERIAEYLAVNPGMTVVGLREGAWITVRDGWARVLGQNGAKIFKSDYEPFEWGELPRSF